MRRASLSGASRVACGLAWEQGGAGVDRAQRAGFFALNCVRVRLGCLRAVRLRQEEGGASWRKMQKAGCVGSSAMRAWRSSRGSCVAVFGVGGVGSSCAEALARGGRGTLIFVDRDTVSPSNITGGACFPQHGRQGEGGRDGGDDGRHQPRGSGRHPRGRSCSTTWRSAAGRSCPDFIVDAVDTVAAKLALARYAADRGIPIVSSMGGANKIDPVRVAIRRLVRDSELPAVPRHESARAEGIERLTVLYSCEQRFR